MLSFKPFVLFVLIFFSINAYSQISDFKEINFSVASNIAKLNEGKDLYNLPFLTYELTHKLHSDVEKFRAIYIWVCQNIRGDDRMSSRVINQREKLKYDSISFFKWNAEYRKKVFKNLLKNKKTMCTGYAYLIKEMANIANIECEIIDGYARNVSSNIDALEMANHSWNAVRLNGKWYLCDATWSSGYTTEQGFFIKDYNDGYFLTDPVLFSKNHFPLKKKWLLKEEINTIDFISFPLIYSEAFKYKIVPKTPNKMDVEVKKNEEVYFSFHTLKEITSNNISLVRYVGNDEKYFHIYDVLKEQDKVSFKTKFKSKGFYDIHVKLENDVLATYRVKVKKS